MKKYIVADYVPDHSKGYLTEGKMYPVVNELFEGRCVEIYTDDGGTTVCRVASSAHLDDRAFRVVEVDDTPKKPTVRDVINRLPECSLKTRILECTNINKDETSFGPTVYYILDGLFFWYETTEGDNYWRGVQKQLKEWGI